MAKAVIAFGSLSLVADDVVPATKRVAKALYDVLTASATEVSLVGFAQLARIVPLASLAADRHEAVYECNVQAALKEARRILVGEADSLRRLVLVLNTVPTAHFRSDGQVFFRYPPADETIDATFGETWRCFEAGIRLDVIAVIGEAAESDRTVAVASALARLGDGLALVAYAVRSSDDDLRELVNSLA